MAGRSDDKERSMTLYRGMKNDGEGQPECGPSARKLGVRLEGDIVIQDDGTVKPGTGGMSVALGKPENLPAHRRDAAFGGFGPDPVWQIEEADLPDTLFCRVDAKSRHGVVEPIEEVPLEDYQEALATSRGFWSQA
jgi:hypothetical protein